MKKDFIIFIFCLSETISNLIYNALLNIEFTVYKYNINDIENLLKNNSNEIVPDCIIIDKEMSKDLKINIRNKFFQSKFICLPSLSENNILNLNDIKYISEPFKLSELEAAINELYNEKIGNK